MIHVVSGVIVIDLSTLCVSSMAPKREHVEGFEAVMKALEDNKDNKNVFVFFCGTTNEKGESWCPDCVEGDFVH